MLMCTVHMGSLVNLGEWFSSSQFSGGPREKTFGPHHTFSLSPLLPSNQTPFKKLPLLFFLFFFFFSNPPKIYSTKHTLKVNTKESWKNKNSKREISQKRGKNNREMWRWGWNKEEERRRGVQVTHNIRLPAMRDKFFICSTWIWAFFFFFVFFFSQTIWFQIWKIKIKSKMLLVEFSILVDIGRNKKEPWKPAIDLRNVRLNCDSSSSMLFFCIKRFLRLKEPQLQDVHS